MAYATLIDGKDGEQIEELDFILETAMLPAMEQAARKNARAMKKWAYKPPTPPAQRRVPGSGR